MKENTNYNKIEKIYKNNGGYLTREDINASNISSWFLSDFVRKNNLSKIAPGFYANDSYTIDEYFILQKRYPKYIFTGLSALYLLGLTDKIPLNLEVSAPKDYHPSRYKIPSLIIKKISDLKIYELGIVSAKTMFGNHVFVYDEERMVCELIKHRDDYDTETFLKAIKIYIKKTNNQIKLMRYAKIMKIEKKVYEVMEVLNNAFE